MNKKILFVYINRFGEYPILHEYCCHLQKKGFRVFYVGLDEIENDFITDEGISVQHINRHQTGSALRLASAIGKRAKQIDPDLIHVFHFRWCFLLPLFSFFFTRYLLDVRTVHVADARGNHSPWSPLKNGITWFESQFYRYAIALTPAIRKMLRPAYKKIPIIPLGANLEKFSRTGREEMRRLRRREIGVDDQTIVFLYSGTLSPVRKIDSLLHAFKKLSGNYNRIFLIIAGHDKDSAASLETLKKLASDLGLAGKTLFTGFLPYSRLIDQYLASDAGICFVPQTPYFDLQPPTKLFEYMAAGLLVIATKTSANKQVITDGVNGFLCEDHPNTLADTMALMFSADELMLNKIKAAAAKSVENYSWDNIIDHYLLPYYQEILNS